MKKSSLLLSFFLFSTTAFSDEILTNNVKIPNPPAWLTESRVDRAATHVGNVLEWNIRRVTVYWYQSQTEFEKLHGFGPRVQAFSRPSDNTFHLGPQVTQANFEPIFQHELTHVIIAQKYRPAIPSWVEEGLANYVAKKGKVDYVWLASQPFRGVTSLTHPFRGAQDSQYHYAASTAVVEMIAAKCSLSDLLQLSVGKKMETYLSTYCNLQDIDGEFKKWIETKGKTVPAATPANRKKR